MSIEVDKTCPCGSCLFHDFPEVGLKWLWEPLIFSSVSCSELVILSELLEHCPHCTAELLPDGTVRRLTFEDLFPTELFSRKKEEPNEQG